MKEILVELVTSPEDLNPGDVVVYASMGRLLTARIEKKPVKDSRYGMGYFKSTRCLVCNKVFEKSTQKWDSKTKSYSPVIVKYNIQEYGFENFNKVKYITFRHGGGIFKVIEQ
jgi:hypothetical protein